MNKLFVILFLWCSNSVFSQSTLEVNILANNKEVIPGELVTVSGKTYQIDLIKFYITNLRFLQDGVIVADFTDQPQLINFEDDSTKHIALSNAVLPVFNEIRFTFGVDSLTNVNGIMSGALDPVNGMYWTWQSGYINCKIEGAIIDNNRKPIEYHLGGYLPDQLAAQEISLPVAYNSNIILAFHLDEILSGLSAKDLFQIMSPGKNAVLASELLVESVQIETK